MVGRLITALLLCSTITSCEPFEESRSVDSLTQAFAGKCIHPVQPLGLFETGDHPVSNFYLDTLDINRKPVVVFDRSATIVVRRVVYATSFEHSQIVVLGDVGGRANVIMSHIFAPDSLNAARRSMTENVETRQTLVLNSNVAEWCR